MSYPIRDILGILGTFCKNILILDKVSVYLSKSIKNMSVLLKILAISNKISSINEQLARLDESVELDRFVSLIEERNNLLDKWELLLDAIELANNDN